LQNITTINSADEIQLYIYFLLTYLLTVYTYINKDSKNNSNMQISKTVIRL